MSADIDAKTTSKFKPPPLSGARDTLVGRQLAADLAAISAVLELARRNIADLERKWSGDWRANRLSSASLNISQAMSKLNNIVEGKK